MDDDPKDDPEACRNLIKQARSEGTFTPFPPELQTPLPDNATPEQEAERAQAIRAYGEKMAIIPRGFIRRGPGAIQKTTPTGKHLGWYRDGQVSGSPNELMPLEADLKKQVEAHGAAIEKIKRLYNFLLNRKKSIDRRAQDGAAVEKQVLELIAKHPGSSNSWIGRKIGITGQRVGQIIKKSKAREND